jgi:hypothetical protein
VFPRSPPRAAAETGPIHLSPEAGKLEHASCTPKGKITIHMIFVEAINDTLRGSSHWHHCAQSPTPSQIAQKDPSSRQVPRIKCMITKPQMGSNPAVRGLRPQESARISERVVRLHKVLKAEPPFCSLLIKHVVLPCDFKWMATRGGSGWDFYLLRPYPADSRGNLITSIHIIHNSRKVSSPLFHQRPPPGLERRYVMP